jgi:hypothetical protein
MRKFSVTALVFALSFAPAFGAVEEEKGSLSAAASKVVTPEAQKMLNIDLFGWAYGPALSNFDGRTATADGVSGSPMTIRTQLAIHTPAFGPFNFMVMPQFDLQPNFASSDRFVLQDPSVGLQGVVYDKNGLTVWTRMEVYAPVTVASRNKNQVANPAITTAISYRPPGTKLRIDTVFQNAISFYGNGEVSSGLYVSPRIYYLMNDSFWLMSILEAPFSGARGNAPLTLEKIAPNLGVGFRYLTQNGKGLWIQPFFDVFPGDRIASSAHFAVVFGGPLL